MKTQILLIGVLGLTLAAPLCAQPTNQTVATSSNTAVPFYGVTALIQETNKPFGKEIVIEGFPTAVCKRSGKKAWLHDTNSEASGTIRVERTGSMPAFSQDAVGKNMRVTGVLRELRLDAAYFDAWESRVKSAMADKNKDEGEKEEGCTEECAENVAAEQTLKNIAAYRKKLAASKKGYLIAFWVDGTKWELIKEKESR
jgi:hypothetical protein